MRTLFRDLRQYPRNLWVLVLGMMINIAGASFIWPLNTIYMTSGLGQTVTIAGIVLMCHAGAGIFGNILGGTLYDRIGGKKTILLGVSMGIICAISLALFQFFTVYVVLMILLGFSNGMVFPAIYAMAGGVWPEGGRKSFNAIYIAQNVGVAVGTALGGLIAELSFTYIFFVNAFTYMIFLIIVFKGLSENVAHQPRGGMRSSVSSIDDDVSKRQARTGFICLMILSLGFMACWMTYVQWQTNISVHMTSLGIPLSAYSLLWTVNGVLIIVCQPISAYLTERVFKSVRSQLLVGNVIFIIALLTLSQQEVYTGFLIAMVIMTIGEIFIWPAVPTAAQALAPEGRKGLYQGVVGSFATAGRMLGPVVGGILYDLQGPQTMMYIMTGICAAALICFTLYDRLLLAKKETVDYEHPTSQQAKSST